MGIKKNLSKLVKFCVAILMLKMEENIQHFQHIMLYYFMKVKDATEREKKDSKLVNFCVAILTLKIEENKKHFWHIMLYYFKKGN